ncbi:hypothetical protein WHT83_14825 [Aminobacter sp. P9b]|uniref:hypothetical protein n=1 Tax=Aminobacter sp. P9b TaxID=3133697 RepID=UPI00324D4AE7
MTIATQDAYLGELYAKTDAERREVVVTHLKWLAHAFENGKLDTIDPLIAAGACLYAAERIGPANDSVASVERVECVSYDTGYEMPADPIWRVEIDGYCADFDFETAARNFAAAINRRSALAGEPGIKALEWTEPGPRNNWVWAAKSIIGTYHVHIDGGRHQAWLDDATGAEPSIGAEVGTYWEAHAAAQADYERRIRSALVHPAPTPVSAPVGVVEALIAEVAAIGTDIPDYATWPIELPAGHWRALASLRSPAVVEGK